MYVTIIHTKNGALVTLSGCAADHLRPLPIGEDIYFLVGVYFVLLFFCFEMYLISSHEELRTTYLNYSKVGQNS